MHSLRSKKNLLEKKNVNEKIWQEIDKKNPKSGGEMGHKQSNMPYIIYGMITLSSKHDNYIVTIRFTIRWKNEHRLQKKFAQKDVHVLSWSQIGCFMSIHSKQKVAINVLMTHGNRSGKAKPKSLQLDYLTFVFIFKVLLVWSTVIQTHLHC